MCIYVCIICIYVTITLGRGSNGLVANGMYPPPQMYLCIHICANKSTYAEEDAYMNNLYM